MKVVYKKEHREELKEILKKFPNARFLKSRNSIVLDNKNSIVKIGTKEEIFHEIKYMRAFSREFNVPKLIRKRLVKELAYMVVEKVKSKKIFKKLNKEGLAKRLINIANEHTLSVPISKILMDFDKNYKIIFGKNTFKRLLKKNYRLDGGDVKTHLIHGDIYINLIGSTDKYYLIDFETVGYFEIEYEIAVFKYIDFVPGLDKLIKLYSKSFDINEEKVDLYGAGLLNYKITYPTLKPVRNLKKLVYFFRLLKLILKYNRTK